MKNIFMHSFMLSFVLSCTPPKSAPDKLAHRPPTSFTKSDVCPPIKLVNDDRVKIEKNLEFLCYFLSYKIKEKKFIEKVVASANKKFDGEHNVLISHLFEPKNDSISNVAKNVLFSKFGKETVNKFLLKGFPTSFSDYGLFPQIFIPFPDSKNKNQYPILSFTKIENWQERSDTLPGFKLTENEFKKISVTESLAKSEYTWIISISESVNCNGAINSVNDNDKPSAERLANCGNFNYSSIKKYIEFYPTIYFAQKKEKWTGGAAEIEYSYAVPCTSNPFINNTTCYNRRTLKRSNGEWKLQNNDLYKNLDVHHHFSSDSPWDWRDSEDVAVIVYEYDWDGTTVYPFGTMPYIYYRSNQNFFFAKSDFKWTDYTGSGCWGCVYTVTSHTVPGEIIVNIGGWQTN